MAQQYLDTVFDIENNSSVVYTDAEAIVIAIKNILLTSPGNYPEHPSYGMDISKYQFEVLDDQTITDIEAELYEQINKYIPSTSGTEINIVKLDMDDGDDYNGIGISVSTVVNGDISTYNFLVVQDHEIISTAVEII